MGDLDTQQKLSSPRAYEDVGFLRAVLQAVPAFVVLVDAEQRIVYINRLQPGFVLENVIGRGVHEFTAPEHQQRQRQAIELALSSGEPQSFLVRVPAADGSTNYYDSRAVPVVYGEGQRAVCLIAVEVTEHIADTEALRESEEKLRILVEATGMGLWSWTPSARKVEWSPRMCEITGSNEPMNLRQYIDQLVHRDDREIVSPAFTTLPQNAPDYRMHRIVRPDGEVRWVMPCGRAQRDEHGEVIRLMGGMLDVTEQHLLQEHLRAAQKSDAIGALTAGIAHNFNNMLAVIVPTLDLLMPDVPEARKPLVEDAIHAARQASELVAQLMRFSGQRGEGERRLQDVTPIVERALSMCQRTFPAQVMVELAIKGACRPVRCDAAAIEQVVVNLLINARDAVVLAGNDPAQVGVEIFEVEIPTQGDEQSASHGYARIAIIDQGVGMSAQVKQHLFEPFFTTKETGRGTGLGLATSYGIVRDHGGFIDVDSTQGRGTTIAIHLPVEGTMSQTPKARSTPVRTGARGTILVVDDEPAVRAIVEESLRSAGHHTLSAGNAHALRQSFAAGAAPDVVLLDRSMPGFPFEDALQLLREHAPRAAVLFFTGQHVSPADRALVDDVLYKPHSLDELLDAVERWLVPRS